MPSWTVPLYLTVGAVGAVLLWMAINQGIKLRDEGDPDYTSATDAAERSVNGLPGRTLMLMILVVLFWPVFLAFYIKSHWSGTR